MLKCLDGLDWELIQDEDGNICFCLESAANNRSLTGSLLSHHGQRPPIRLGTDGLLFLILSIEAYPREHLSGARQVSVRGFNRNAKQRSTPERGFLISAR